MLSLAVGRETGEMYSHSLVGLAVGASVAWAVYAVAVDRAAAGTIALAWLLHWPADFITAYKPLLDPHHQVGLDLYSAPLADFALEGLLVMAGCVIYARTYAGTARQRAWIVAAGAALIALQGMLDFGLSRTNRPAWHPRLAVATWRPQLRFIPGVQALLVVRMALALSLVTSTSSEQWRPAASSPWSA